MGEKGIRLLFSKRDVFREHTLFHPPALGYHVS